MAETKIQGVDAFAALQQVRGVQQNGRNDGDLGAFGDLMERAAGILETARMSRGDLQMPQNIKAASSNVADDISQLRIGSTQKQDPAKSAADNHRTDRQNNIGQEDKTNARVTDDNAKTGKDPLEAADDAGRKLMSEVAEKLDIDEEDVAAAMEVLGITAIELLDPANLTALLTELSGENDPMALVTDADLYQVLKDLTQMAEELSEEIGITPEDVPEFARQFEIAVQNGGAESAEAALAEADMAEAESAKNTPVRVQMSDTDADGNVVSVQVTVEDGALTRTQVTGEAENNGQEHEESGRHSRGQKAQLSDTEDTMADDVIGQIASRMTDEQVSFADTSVQQTTATNTQQMVEIVRQITEQIRVNFGADVTSMELTLHPASLGNVQLTVTQDATGRMVAQFTVENETVRQAIESQVSQLQQRLDAQGVRIEAVEITIASHGFESNLQQQTGQQADQQRDEQIRAAGPRGTRRINLDELDPEEELAEEERIAAEMMAANGNTVDYTA